MINYLIPTLDLLLLLDKHLKGNVTMRHVVTRPEGGTSPGDNSVTPGLHEALHVADQFYDPSLHGISVTGQSQPISHHNIGPTFPYPAYDKCFSSRVKPISHQTTQTGEHPYACSKCGKFLSRSPT